MSTRLLQLSGVVVDLLYDVEAVPSAGEEAIVNGFSITPGGGFNAMVAAKRAGMEVSYGGGLGTGPFARTVREGLNQQAIPFLRPQDTERDQGCCTVMIDRSGERTFVASDGAEGHATMEEISKLTALNFDWILLSGYALHYQGSCGAMQQWLQSDAPVANLAFDPSPVVAALPSDALAAACKKATWISANVREAAVLTGTTDAHEAAKTLAAKMPDHGGAVVRHGKHGCIIATHDFCESIAAFEVTPVDTNGAGDAHLGSFIARLAAGDTPFQAARYANVAAALATTKRGPATAPLPEEVFSAHNQKEAV
ncbi:MAG: PfkB family carbohydrate kinase [Pseudomonadota bacterium]